MALTAPPPLNLQLVADQATNTVAHLQKLFPNESENIQTHVTELSNYLTTSTKPAPSQAVQNQQFNSGTPSGTGQGDLSTFTPTANNPNCVSDWVDVFLDGIGLILSVVGFDSSDDAAAEIKTKLNKDQITEFEVVGYKLNQALDDWQAMKTDDFTCILNVAKGLFGLFQALWKTVVKALMDALADDMSWWNWLLLAAEIIAQALLWFATDGLALLGKLALMIISAIDFVEAWNTAKSCCTIEQFFEDLKSEGGVISNTKTIQVIQQHHNPAVIEFQKKIYVFYNDGNNGIEYFNTTLQQLQDGISYENNVLTTLKKNLPTKIPMPSTKQTTSTPTDAANTALASLPAAANIRSWITSVPGVANNASSPSLVVYPEAFFLYVFYMDTGNPALIHYAHTNDFETWYHTTVNTEISTSTAPFVFFNSLASVPSISLYYQGTGPNKWIWTANFNGDNFNDPNLSSCSGFSNDNNQLGRSTSTIPMVAPYSDGLIVMYRSTYGQEIEFYLADMPGYGFEPNTFNNSAFVTNGTPAFCQDGEGNSIMLFTGIEKPPLVYTHAFPDLTYSASDSSNSPAVIDWWDKVNAAPVSTRINSYSSPKVIVVNKTPVVVVSSAPSVVKAYLLSDLS